MRTKLLLVWLFILIIPYVSANRLELNQDWGWITGWDEIKYVIDSNLIVESQISLSLSRVLYNYSNNYTFEFSPWEPWYLEPAEEIKIEVYNKCNQISLQYFKEPYINCKNGAELIEDIDYYYKLVDQYNWPQKAFKITIFHNNSIKEWTTYQILIRYKLRDFVKKKGNEYYFQLEKNCMGKDKCPNVDSVHEEVFLANPNYKLEDYPSNALKDVLLNGMEYISVDGLDNGYTIYFTDVKETNLITPFIWVIIGVIIGLVPTFLIYFINRIIYAPHLRITFNNKPSRTKIEYNQKKGTGVIGIYNKNPFNTIVESFVICYKNSEVEILKPSKLDVGDGIQIEGNTVLTYDSCEQANRDYSTEPIYVSDYDTALKNVDSFTLGPKHNKVFFFDYNFKKNTSFSKIMIVVDAIIDEAHIPPVIDMFSSKRHRIKQALYMELKDEKKKKSQKKTLRTT